MLKRWVTVLLSLVLVLSLAGCGTSQNAADSEQETVQESKQTEPENRESEKGPTATASAAETPSGSKEADAEQPSVTADKFIFRSSEEMKSFMQDYEPTAGFEYGETYWTMSGDEFTVSGTLMPDDHERFVSFRVETLSSLEEDRIAPALLSAYQEICDKTGLTFEGAEDAIRQILSLEDFDSFGSGEYNIRLSRIGKSRYELRMMRDHAEYGDLPYTVEHARAWMQSIGGKDESIRISVTPLTGSENPRFDWSGTLDEAGHLVTVQAQYSGGDPEEGKSFFQALTDYLLKDDVREGAARLISEEYDALEKNKTKNANADGYKIQLRNRSDYYQMTFNVRGMQASPDAVPFPPQEEMDRLKMDPFTKLGIDTKPQIPETVLFDQAGMKIVFERCLYSTNGPSLMFVLRADELPPPEDPVYLGIRLKAVNGASTDPIEDIIAYSNDYSRIDLNVHSEDLTQGEELYFTLTVSALEEITDFTGLDSLTFEGQGSSTSQGGFQLGETTLKAAQ